MKTKAMKPSQVLRKAKKLIEKPKKWQKGGYSCNGRYCVNGAVGKTINDDANSSFGIASALNTLIGLTCEKLLDDATKKVIKNKNRKGYNNSIEFNDNPKTDHNRVMRLFDVAIEIAEKKEKLV